MSFSEAYKFSGESIEHFAHLIDNMQIGFWEHNTATKNTQWSSGFYTMLGHVPGEIECSYNNFIENILYHGDKVAFLQSTAAIFKQPLSKTQVRLLTKESGYQWFECISGRQQSPAGAIIYGLFDNVNPLRVAQLKDSQNIQAQTESNRIAKLGSWEINAATNRLYLSDEIYHIFELQNPVPMSVSEAISFFEPHYRPIITKAVDNALRFSKPYDLELQLRTAKNNVTWVRSKGVAIVDDLGQCQSVRGIFQDIDIIKNRGISMQSSINLLDDQNKRLQNFAYIVSHNLRSHTGNLKLMLSLFEEADETTERDEVFDHIKTISNSLNLTISHLDEIVKIQADVAAERKKVNLNEIFDNVLAALHPNIQATGAQINIDFSACFEISYIPAYMESIVHNLLTNAIKYRHPDRPPIINCQTQKTDNGVYLIIEDNGSGIDMSKNGNEIFGLYKTFHQNDDAKGIGLFITRNQIEALGGTIHLESTVNVGTKFTVKLT